MIVFKEKQYTKWDNTDQLKRMRDSDILAEKKRSGTLGNTAATTALGMAGGAAAGSVIGGTRGLLRHGGSFTKGLRKGGLAGGLIVGGIAGTAAAIKNSKKQKDINFYNNRLEYAQRQARRRERADWKQNMTQREGYTY
jgi:hypothetical protein